MLGTRQSYSQREKQRSTLYFETTDEAAVRVAKRKRQEDLGVRKKKRHSPQPNQLDFNKENLLKEVQNMKEGDKVRFNLLILVTVKFLTSTINTHNTM